MVGYRLYCLDRNGQISTAEWFEAADDADAIRKASDLKRLERKCEVWRDRRLIVTLEAEDLASRTTPTPPGEPPREVRGRAPTSQET